MGPAALSTAQGAPSESAAVRISQVQADVGKVRPVTELAALSEKTLALANACPRCEAPAAPAAAIQACARCKKPFLLVAGLRRANASNPQSAGKSVKVKYGEG